MARAAFLMDRLMGGVGLHGRAFIPLLSSFACAIPGILSTRTIENPKDRLITILIAPFMTCSARLPVYTLIVGALIPDRQVYGIIGLQGLVMFALYAAGITGALMVAFVMKRGIFGGEVEPLMLSLPNYIWPRAGNLALEVWMRGWAFLRRAGTIIFLVAIGVWFLVAFPLPPEGAIAKIDDSYAGMLGQFIQPLMAPIGFSWQMTLSLIPAMTAREVAIAVLGTIYAVDDNGTESLASALRNSWSLAAALSYLTWFVFAPQCFSTLVVVRRETNSRLWPVVMFGYMTIIAYIASLAVYRASLAFL
jgi:ferrous iron transport protein B